MRVAAAALAAALVLAAGCSPGKPVQAGPRGPAPAPVPGRPRLPQAGTYLKIVVSGGSRDEVTSTLTLEGSEITLAEPDGTTNATIVNRFEWRADGIYSLGYTVLSPSGRRYDCVYHAPMLQLPFPIEVGRSWQATGLCSLNGVQVSVQATSTISGTAWVTIAGRRVLTYVIRGTTASGTSADYQGTSASTIWFDPAAGLPVQEDGGSAQWQSGGGEASRSSERWTLASLTPN